MPATIQSTMIRASAGSGKTWQLSNRFLALMSLGVAPEKIIALTFTRKAAGEFTGRIMTRLAVGAASEEGAHELAGELKKIICSDSSHPNLLAGEVEHLPEMDQHFFQGLLKNLVASLDRLALSTLDSYFVSIVRNFALELGLSGFDLLEDHSIASERLVVMATIFSNEHTRKEERLAFLNAFKQATWGEEENRLCRTLENFVRDYQDRWLTAPDPDKWGGMEGIWPNGCSLPEGGDYYTKAQRVRSLLGDIENAHGSYINSWKKACDWMEARSAGAPMGSIPARIVDSLQALEEFKCGHYQTVFSQREQVIQGELAQAVYVMCGAFLRDEIETCMQRTQGLFAMIAAYENRYHEHVRSRGRLCFSDLTLLLAGEGVMQLWEDDARHLIDFRLDARYDHWMLDEFQDTSQSQWHAVQHLIDEIMQDTEGSRSLFVVGDSKQSIYGWRGGEPRLFDDLKDYYGGRLQEWNLDASYRSSSHVLDLVNRVCDLSDDKWSEVFPAESLARWNFRQHIAAKEKQGHALVLEAAVAFDAKSDEKTAARYDTMKQLIEYVDPLEKRLSCAVLVTKNSQVTAVVDYLRSEFPGMPVASESEEMIADGPEGAVILDLFRWLQSPSHEFGRIHMQLSPIKTVIEEITTTEDAGKQWSVLTKLVAKDGVEVLIDAIVKHIFKSCDVSPYGESRLREISSLAHTFSREGGSLSEWVMKLESSRLLEVTREGVIQVMTVHKSKGLGFDVVILPDLDENRSFTDAGQLRLIERKGNLGSTDYIIKKPSKVICDAEVSLSAMMRSWEADQCYERFCNLYVALTRAVHATYCIVNPVRDSWLCSDRYADWIREATSCDDLGSVDIGEETYATLYSSGDWLEGFEKEEEDKVQNATKRKLHPGKPRLTRRIASEFKPHEVGSLIHQGKGIVFGKLVHQLFEKITWLDEMPELGDEPSSRVVAECLRLESIRPHFTRPEGHFRLLREQPIETRIGKEWVSGVIDRAVVLFEENKPVSISIIDFKSDTGETIDSLREKYSAQLALYRKALAQIYQISEKSVHCYLLSTSLKEMIDVI